MRRLDIGTASYRNPGGLDTMLRSIERHAATNWRCFIVHNPSAFGDEEHAARSVIMDAVNRSSRFVPVWMETNAGYAGAVNALFGRAETEYIAYLDNDAEILTPAWDEQLCSYLDRFHEIGIIFPNGGPYPINRGQYLEVMWGVGYAFIVNRLAARDAGGMDETIGHQNEADYALRLRMAGWKCAAAPEVHVLHHARASGDPASAERIARGVREFVDKWCKYFCGKAVNYHSPNVLRWEDWPPNALYLEEYWRGQLPQLNASPEAAMIDGREYDLIRVPRLGGFYRGRII